MAAISASEGLWLHVDAAYGGSAAVVPELRFVLAGAERADSIVVNPHKWLFVPIDLSVLHTRRPDLVREAATKAASGEPARSSGATRSSTMRLARASGIRPSRP